MKLKNCPKVPFRLKSTYKEFRLRDAVNRLDHMCGHPRLTAQEIWKRSSRWVRKQKREAQDNPQA